MKIFLFCFIFTFSVSLIFAQSDSIPAQKKDTTTNQDAIYNRPFIQLGRTTTAVGGYLEGNTNYFVTDGVPDGFSMEMRRFNIFLYSTIAKRIRFLSELEFEHGTDEIALETALIDFEFNQGLILRAGIILPPVGGFNLNHDSPRWEFVERPLVSTGIIPSTLSEIGFGLNGKFYPTQNIVLTYDAYLVQGLGDGVILNTSGRTFLQAGKFEDRFEEDNNGTPSMSGKLGLRHRKIGEIGLSYYGGVYNTFRLEGITVDSKRSLHLMAVDYRTNIKKLSIVGEAAYTMVDVPTGLTPIFGKGQWGIFTDFIYPVIKRPMFKWENAVINASLRLERVDFNTNKFENGDKVYDEVNALAFGLGFRPSANTIIRANYRYHWIRDILGNPTVRQAGIQVGVASYF
jgi:hypothetical protein